MLYEKTKMNKGRRKKGLYHTRNNPKNNMKKRKELNFAKGVPKLKHPREELCWSRRQPKEQHKE